jgi:23S rRNA (uracil1939-C5)-methyltransferase
MKKEFVENIEAYDISDEGKAVLRHNGRVIFVKGLVPGDIADIEITRAKKKHAEGKIIILKTPSPNRIKPVCEHFGVCGGCSWQNLDYKIQLELKQKQVTEAFRRIAGVTIEESLPIIGSEKIYHYRNKLEFTSSSKRWLTHEEMADQSNFGQPGLGFHVPKLFDKVIDIKQCHLQPEPSNAIRLEVRDFAVKNNMPFFDLREQQGFLRNLMVRNTSTGEVMVMVALFREDKAMREKLLKHIAKTFPQITTLIYAINPKKNDSLYDLEMETYSGNGYITEKLKLRNGKDLTFRISPQSFFQTNTAQANVLYAKASEFAEFKGTENVFDLYTGCGTIASFIAGEVKRVVGIESVKQAVIDARTNAELNGITNAEFFTGDMQYMLSEDFYRHNGIPDVVITDPPRIGMHPDTVKDLLKAAPEKIVYISCNPSTQARDIAILAEKYKVKKNQPVDMFPHTSHVENIALLVKK